jgi:hypothetical protein
MVNPESAWLAAVRTHLYRGPSGRGCGFGPITICLDPPCIAAVTAARSAGIDIGPWERPGPREFVVFAALARVDLLTRLRDEEASRQAIGEDACNALAHLEMWLQSARTLAGFTTTIRRTVAKACPFRGEIDTGIVEITFAGDAPELHDLAAAVDEITSSGDGDPAGLARISHEEFTRAVARLVPGAQVTTRWETGGWQVEARSAQ